MHVEDS